ncbi:MAG: XrtA/PEP-CTERM system exopolysaccharide export protein [Pseudomonadota bacterium]
MPTNLAKSFRWIGVLLAALALSACASRYPEAPPIAEQTQQIDNYLIGPGDDLEIFVWRHPDLSSKVPVRPDGKISVPLIEDLQAAGKTPGQLGSELETQFAEFILEPNVTVIVTDFIGQFSEQIRIIGEVTNERAIPFRQGMTVLDAALEVGGLTEFAAGNRAVIVRREGDEEKSYRVRLGDLLRNADVSANVTLLPGDVLIVPEKRF